MSRVASRLGVLGVIAGAVLVPGVAQAAFSVTPLTWNVIGLDSNSPLSGPRNFPVGARVCSTVAASNIAVNWFWDTPNANVNLRPGSLSTVTIPSLAPGACADAYFEVAITPVAAAYDTARRYHIVAADGVSSASSPTPREVYVEHLISQSRNAITDIKLNGTSIPAGGSMNLLVGNTYAIELDGGTATQGYNQFESFINFPNTIFQILSVSTTYSADNSPYVPGPAPIANDKLYADACLWQNDPASPNYRSCIGGDYKAGGNDVRTTYTVKIIGGGGTSQVINSLLYDFSGSSYHYNADFGVGARIANVIDPTALTFAKAFVPTPTVAGGTSTLTFTITNPNGGAVGGLSFGDTLPTSPGQMVVATPATYSTSGCGTPTFAPVAGATAIAFSNGTVAANSSCVVSVLVRVPAAPTSGTYANVSGNLFVGGLDSGHNAAANLVLAAATPATNICGLTLAQWTMPPAAGTTVPPLFSFKGSDVATATAAAGAGITSTIDTSIGNLVNSWAAIGFSTAATLTTANNDYFQFAATTTNYTAIGFKFDARIDTNLHGPRSLQLYSSTDGTTFTAYGSALSPTGTFATFNPAFTGTANASGLTYFRIYGYNAGNNGADADLFVDNVTITGCQPAQPPTIAKTFLTNPIAVGGTSTLRFTLTNPNTAALTGVKFTDALPAGLQVAASPSASTTCTGSPTWAPAPGATTLSFGQTTGAGLPASGSCTVSVNVTATTAGPHTNVSGFVSSTESGTNTGSGGSAVASLTAVLPPSIAKSFGKNPVQVNGASLLTFTITNPNPNDALSGIAFADTYPGGLANVNPLSPPVVNTCGGSVTAAAGGNSISLAGGTVAAGGSCSVAVTVTASVAGDYANTSGAVSAVTAGTGNAASATLTVTPPHPAIGLIKQISTSAAGPWFKFVTVAPGTLLYYRFTVENTGDVPLNPFGVSDPALAGTAADPATCTWQSSNAPPTLPVLPVATATVDPTATCVMGPISAVLGDHANTATAQGTYSGTQYASSPSTADYIGATPGFSLLKQVAVSGTGPWTSAVSVATAGTNVYYRFTLVNTGGLVLSAINVTDPLVSTATCTFTDPLATGGATMCVVGPVATVGGNGSTTTNTATGHGTNGGTTYDTAISSASYTVGTASADLAVTKIVDNGTPNVGSNVTFTVTVTNNGPSNAAGVQVSDLLPAGYAFVSATPSVGSYVAGTGIWTIGALANGANATLSVTATVNANGSYTNSATVSATTADPNAGNNSASVGTTPIAQADLQVAKIVDNGTPNVGSNVTFTVTVTNNGPSDAAGVQATDLLPAGYAFVSATPSVGSYVAGTGIWTIGALANGANATLSVTATVLTSGSYTNSATVSATTADPNAANNSASVGTTPVAQADLQVAKIVDSGTPNVGSNVTFTVTVTNNGPSDAAGVQVSDLLPAGYAFVSATPSVGSYVAGTGIWTIGALANGASATLSVTATVLASGSYTNSATVSATTADPNAANNSASVGTTPVAQADLAVTKIVNNGTPNVGGNATFTVTVTNNGPSDAAGVQVTDLLPTGYALVSATPSTGSYVAGTGIWTIGALANGASATLSITATVLASGSYTNSATVSATTADPNAGNNSASAGTTPIAQADLQVAKIVDNGTPNVGGNVTFTVTVTNNGPSNAAGVQVSDLLPAGYAFVSATPSVGSYVAGTGIWTIGALANGASATLSMTATALASGSYTNTATVSATTADPNASNNTASVGTTPVAQADLAVTKIVNNGTPNVGGNVTFTVTVTNNGPSDAAGVQVSDALPAGYAFMSATPSTGSYVAGTGIWTIGALANGASATLSVTATVLASGSYTNSATVSATTADPNAANNSASVGTTPIAQADLQVAKIVDNGAPNVGSNVTFTVTVTNNGPSDAAGVQVTDLLPAGYAFVSATPSVGSYVPGTGIWTVGALANGANATLSVTATVNASGSYTNTATVSATTADPNANNNTASAGTSPVAVSSLTVTKTDNSATYTPGGIGTYVVVVTNAGPSAAAAVTVSDTLPAGVTLTGTVTCVAAGTATCGSVTGIAAQGSFGATGATIAAGAGNSLTFTAPVAYASALVTDPLVNTATATDPASPNAEGSDSSARLASVALAVAKTDGSGTYTPGGTATYMVTVTSTGPTDAANVTVTDTLPAGLTLTATVTCTPNGVASCGTVTGTSGQTGFGATGATLGAGAGDSLVFSVPVAFAAGMATNPLVNTATATDVATGATANGSDSNTLAPQVSLAVVKTDGSSTYTPGGTATYTVTVTNGGLSTANSVTIADALPAGVTLTANATCIANGASSCGTVTGTTGQASFGATGAVLVPGAPNSLVYTVPVKFAAALATDPLVNTATATDGPSGATGEGSDSDARALNVTLTVAKTDGSLTYTPGSTATYTVTIGNTGMSDALNVTVNDALPAGVTLTGIVTCTANGIATCGTVTGIAGQANFGTTGGGIGAGGGNTLVFTAPVAFAANLTDNPLINTATATDVASGATASGSDSDARSAQANLAITKTDGSATYTPGGTGTYSVVVTNGGPTSALAVTVADALPAGVTLNGAVGCVAAGAATCGTVTGSAGQSSFGATGATITAGAGNSLTFTAPVAFAAGMTTNPLVNTATAAEGANPPVSAVDSDTLSAQISLAVTKSDGATIYTPGGTAIYTITIHNTGISDAVNITVGDPLPAGVTLNGTATCVAAGSASCGTVTGTAGQTSFGATTARINAGPANSLTFAVPVAFAAGLATNPLVNTVTVTDLASGVTATASDSDSRVQSGALGKAIVPSTILAGGTATLTLSLGNSNAVPLALTALFSDPMPTGVTTTSGNSGTCTGVTVTAAAVTMAAGSTIPPGGCTIIVTITSSTAGAVTNVTGSLVTAAGTTPPASASLTVTAVIAPVPPTLTKTIVPATIAVGGTATLTIALGNANASPLTLTAGFIDAMPAGVTTTSANTGTCAAAVVAPAQITIANGATIPAGGCTIIVTVTSSTPGMVTNTTSSLQTATGAAPPASAPITVTAAPSVTADLAITKTNNVASVTPGGVVTYSIVATNHGPDAVAGATVTDVVPASLTGVTWTCVASAGSSCPAAGNGNINASVDLSPGGSSTFTLSGTLLGSASGTLTNTATIAVPAGITDPVPGNNSATDTDPIMAAPVDLTIAKVHVGSFVPGQIGAQYTIRVTNVGTVPSSGIVTVTDTLPAGLSATAIAGAGWTCAQPSGPCTRSDALPPGGSYPVLTLTVNVAANPPSSLINAVSVAGGGDLNGANNQANDQVTFAPIASDPESIPVDSPAALLLLAAFMMLLGAARLRRNA